MKNRLTSHPLLDPFYMNYIQQRFLIFLYTRIHMAQELYSNSSSSLDSFGAISLNNDDDSTFHD